VNAYIVRAYQEETLKAEYIFETLKSAMIFATKMAGNGYLINFVRKPLEDL